MLKAIKLILLILFISPCLCLGQSFRFQFYRIKACSTIEKLDTDYALYKIPGSLDTSYAPKGGVTYLPARGKYFLIPSTGTAIDTVFDIRDTGLTVFRFKEPDHGLILSGATDTPPLYSQCDSLLNGYAEYHYPDGTLEMRGTFIKGYPRDSIAEFYPNGKLERRSAYYPKRAVTEKFDSLGRKTHVYISRNKSFMIYQDTWEKDFYPNGGIKRDKSTVKHIERIKAYYPGGQLKTIQTKTYRDEYYDNGSKKITYRWKKKRDDRRSGAFIITKTEYDETGAVAGRMVYEYWYSDPIAQPRMSIQQSDWIDSFEKFEAGKKVLSVEDMDTKDFLKKYPDDTDEE